MSIRFFFVPLFSASYLIQLTSTILMMPTISIYFIFVLALCIIGGCFYLFIFFESLLQTKLEIDFGSGTLVEVRSDEEGFEGAWFAAKIVNSTGKNIFMIEYQHLRTDDESQLLRETVYSQNIRPVPPDILEAKDFYLLEEVDALYNDGWWVGIISKVLKDSRYIVYFRDTQEEMEFKLSELRPHQDWIGGKWVRASQVRISITSLV